MRGGQAVRSRRASVRTRILTLGLAAVVLLGLSAAVAVVVVVGASSSADTSARLGAAVRANAETESLLREVHAAATSGSVDGDGLEAKLRALAERSVQVPPLAGEDVTRAVVTAAGEAEARYAEAVRRSPDSAAAQAAFESALAARQQLGRDLSSALDRSTGRVDDRRRSGLIALLSLLLVGSVLLVGASVVLARGVVEPLRELGRVIRRFGDGDLGVRAEVAPDEVGTLARSFNVAADHLSVRLRDLSARARQGDQLRVISEALDLADEEGDAHRILEHGMAMLAPSVPMELLVEDGLSSALHQVAVSPSAGAPNCPVEHSADCVAIRRGQAMVFDDSESINVCPKLRDRPSGRCSAACVPVTAGGQILGVVHLVGAPGVPPDLALIEQLGLLANEAGVRIASLRTLASTRLQAATDTLTGLANRRALESYLGDLIRTGTPFVVALADLDRFKSLNDTYGHEVGDRALQLFANVLAANVRDRDLVARLGGEEFVIVLNQTPVSPAIEALERIRAALSREVADASLPPFTASFGVTHSSVAGDVDGVLRVADAGLLMAKELGRDRIVVADEQMAAEVFARRPQDSRPLRTDQA